MQFLSLLSIAALAVAAPVIPEKRQYTGQSTENQLTDGTACRAITVIFARGTTEAGNVGSLVGPPFFQALVSAVGASNVAVQGVNYPADVAGFLAGGSAAGSQTLASLVGTAQSRCPNTKLVLSGYSQGAQVVHNGAALLTTSQTNFVNSVVTFGDPDEFQAVGNIPSSKVKVFCNAGDDICTKGDVIVAAHLTYGANAAAAASFVRSKAGL